MSLIPETQNYPLANDQYAGIAKPASSAQLTAGTQLDPNTGARLFVPCDLYASGGAAQKIFIIRGNQEGSLPTGSTVFFGASSVRGSEVPLYIAATTETVTRFEMLSLTGNGAAHSDVYTIVKNGVATTMTFTVTNGSTGSTTSNQVSLVAGDRISVRVATDAATTASDVIVQFAITR